MILKSLGLTLIGIQNTKIVVGQPMALTGSCLVPPWPMKA